MCVCVFTLIWLCLYLYISISLYLYIFIDIYISLLIFTSSIYTNIYIYTYIHTYIYIYILSPSLFSKISCCSLRFFFKLHRDRAFNFSCLLICFCRRLEGDRCRISRPWPFWPPKKDSSEPTNPQEISGKHTFAVSFQGGFFPPWKITSMGFVRFL